jgi:hypothetical protein
MRPFLRVPKLEVPLGCDQIHGERMEARQVDATAIWIFDPVRIQMLTACDIADQNFRDAAARSAGFGSCPLDSQPPDWYSASHRRR